MHGAFHGEVAEFYARYRRGFPPPILEAVVQALHLAPTDTVLDLGCGSGQLTLPLSRRVGQVVGIDPEPDMLRHARTAARAAAVDNVDWVLAAARDLERVAAPYGPVAAVTVANTIHLLDPVPLFTAVRNVLRPGGGLAVIANGTPVWLQDSAWATALRAFLQRWSGLELAHHCGTDEHARAAYREELTALGYTVTEIERDYEEILTLEQLVGTVFSAMADRLPAPAERPRFAAELARAVAGTGRYVEHVPVRALIAHRHAPPPPPPR